MLKVFAIRECLTDWSSGSVVVVAKDRRAAWAEIRKQDPAAYRNLRREGDELEELDLTKPDTVITWGGG